jgi:zinc protease
MTATACRAATLTAVVFGAVVASAPAAAQRAELERVIQRRVLDNGLEVIVAENHGVPLATVELAVKNGAFTQTPETAGLAHLYEHMFFAGNADYPDEDDFRRRAGELGAVYNGTTQEERVNYYLTLPADSLAGGIELLASAAITPSFRAEEMRQEREVVIGEFDRNESNPFFPFQRAMERALWTAAWFTKNTLGTREVILAATPAIMRSIQQRFYVPTNSALIITGDVHPDSAFAMAARYFARWKRAPAPGAPPAEPAPLARDDAVITEAPVAEAVVLLQWHGPSVGRDPQATYAADVFSDALNQPGSGFQKRLVDSGLWRSVGVNYYTLNHVGPITISGQTTPARLREALAALNGEIARFDDPGYVSAAELEYVKQQRKVGTAFGVERASGFAHTLSFWWSVADLEYYMGYVDNMARQTPDDLRRYAARYIVAQPKVTGALLSSEARQSIGLTAADLTGAAVRTAP